LAGGRGMVFEIQASTTKPEAYPAGHIHMLFLATVTNVDVRETWRSREIYSSLKTWKHNGVPSWSLSWR
jgi:hypothetical protein